MLGVIDQQGPDAGVFGGQQIRVRGERIERCTDQFGGTQRRNRGLQGGHPDRRTQQHHLFVLLGELAGGGPFRAPRRAPQPLQLLGIDATFGTARQEISQLGGEPGGAERRPQLGWPEQCTVFDITFEQFPDDAVLLGTGDQPRRRVTGTLGRQPQHREGVGVQGAHHGLADHTALLGIGPADSSAEVSWARSRAPGRPEPVSTSTDSISAPAQMRATAVSTSRLLLPVPAPPRTRTTPWHPGCSSADAEAGQTRRGPRRWRWKWSWRT